MISAYNHFESTYFFSFLALFKSTPYNPTTVNANTNWTNLKKISKMCAQEIFTRPLISLSILVFILLLIVSWVDCWVEELVVDIEDAEADVFVVAVETQYGWVRWWWTKDE